MDLNRMFKLTEEQQILNEINEQSAYMKDMERYMSYGYARGIVETLKIVKKGESLEGEVIHKLIVDSLEDNPIDKMVKRLLENE